jgi:toxin YhaV
VIVYAWVNDRDTLRKAGAGTDPYAVFAAKLTLEQHQPDWKERSDVRLIKLFAKTKI